MTEQDIYDRAIDAIEKAKREGKSKVRLHPMYRCEVTKEHRESIAKFAAILKVELHCDHTLDEGEIVAE